MIHKTFGKWKENYTIQRALPGIHNDPHECEMQYWECLLISYGSGGIQNVDPIW